MPIHCNELTTFSEAEATDQFVHQNKKLLKINLAYGPVNARMGSMVAYQGDARFENTGSGGMTKMLKKAVTGEGVNVMKVTGSGEVFIADQATDIIIMYLENDMVSVNGRNVLAFSDSIEWDIQRVGSGMAGMQAGGLYTVVLRGTGYVAVTTDGPPVMLDVTQQATFGDAQAVVLWSAGVQMNIKTDTGGMKSMLRGGTGETFQMAFAGQGFVLVQPSEGALGGPAAAGGSGGGGGGFLGGLGG